MNNDSKQLTGVTVKIIDANGNEKIVSASEAKKMGLATPGSLYNTPIYKTATGYSTDPNDSTKVNVSLDKKTGKITVEAPQYVLDRDEYKEVIKPQLEQLSSYYRQNPNYKFASTEGGKEMSIEEWVQGINKDMSDINYLDQAKNIDRIVKEARASGYGDANDKWAQVLYSGNSEALSSEANDNTRVNVSNFADFNFFEGLDSWDAETKTVSLGDFKKIWNRGKLTDDTILDIRRKIDDMIGTTVTYDNNGIPHITESPASTRGSFADYATLVAMRHLIDNKSPEVGVFRGAIDTGSAIFMGAMDTTLGTLLQIGDFILPGDAGINEAFQEGLETYRERTETLNSNALVFDTISQFVTVGVELATSIFTGGITGGLAAVKIPVVSGRIASATQKITKLGKAADALADSTKALKAAKTVEEVKKATKAFNTASAALKAEDVVGGVSTILRYGKATDAAKLAAAAVKTTQAVERIESRAIGVYSAVDAVTRVASFVADSVYSTILIEPELLNKIAEGDPDGQTTQELIKNLAIDSAVFAGLKSAALGLQKFSETTIGEAVSGNAARVIAKLEVGLTDAKNAVKTAIFRNTPSDIAKKNIEEGVKKRDSIKTAKGVAQAGNIEITNAKRRLASTERIHWVGKDLEEIRKLTEPVRNARLDVMKVNNAVDMIQRGVRAKMNEAIIDNQQMYDDLMSSFNSINKIEKDLGTLSKRVDGIFGERLHLTSQMTSNYITATNRISVLERRAGGNIKNLSAEDAKSYEDAKAQVKLFLENSTPELKQAADNFLLKLQASYKQFTDYFLEKGIGSMTEITSLRETYFWGVDADEYIRSQRIKESKGQFIAKEKKLTATTQKLQSGTGDFADPMLVFTDWLAKMSDKANRTDAARMLLAGSNPTKLASNTKTQSLANATHEKQSLYDEAVTDSFSGAIEQLQKSDLFKNMFMRQEGGKKIATQRTMTEKAYKTTMKAREKKYTSSRAARSVYIAELPEGQLGDLAQELVGYRTPTELINTMIEQGYTAEEAFQYWLSSVPDSTKKYVERYITQTLEAGGREAVDVLTHANYRAIADVDGLFEQNIMSSMLSSNKEYRDSELVTDAIAKEQRDYAVYQKETLYNEEVKALKEMQQKFGMTGEEGWGEGELFDRARDTINDALDFIIESAIGHNKGRTLQAVMDTAGTTDEATKAYVAMLSLKKGSKNRKALLDHIENAAKEEFDGYNKAYGLGKKMISDDLEKQKDQFINTIRRMADDELSTRFSDLHHLMAETKNPVADYDYAFEGINKLKKDIDDIDARADVIGIGVRNGEVEYFETTPTIVELVKTNVGYTQARGRFSDIGYFWSKLFRMGTTGLRAKSWAMQTSRDSIGLFSGVGQFSTLTKVASTTDGLFGPELVEHMKQFDSELYARVRKQLEQAGKKGDELELELQKAAVQREFNIGFGHSTTASETAAYQYRQDNYGSLFGEDADRGVTIGKFSKMLDDITNKPTIGNTNIWNPFNMNQRREDYMRRLAYSNSFSQGMKKGYGVENSRAYAEFIMNNSTTNFSRTIVHFANLQRSVPYLGAAINGTKSFYRLFALDPVGVMGRLVGGVILPATAITCISLSDEENRKVYNNIPEYEKADNICIVWDGRLIKVPIPQEMRSIFGIPRMFVEKLYGTGYNSFWELAANNAIGISPIDLSGFLNLDNKNLFKTNPDIWDNLQTGFVKASAGLMNPGIKTAVMLATGVDPYTGKKINTAHEYTDPDTLESYVVDYDSGEFAKWLAGVFGQDVNAWMAQVVVDNLIGKAGNNVLNSIVTMGNQINNGGDVGSAIGGAIISGLGIEEAAGAFSGPVYDRAQSAWSYAMKQLQDQKNQIVNSKEYQQLNNSITFADEEGKQKIRGKLNDLLQPLYQNTLTAVNELNSKYGAQFTRTKFAAVLSLLNTAKANPLVDLSNYTSTIRQDEFYAGRNIAVETMYRMGFTSPNDGSIFGYVKKSGDNVSFVFQDPLAILASEQLGYAQQDIHTANLKAVFDAAGVKANAWKDDYYSLNSKQKKVYAKDWNSRIVKIMAPYIQQYGVDAVVRNETMGEFLNDYIIVPYGKTPKSYIQAIFKEED